ncbi:MAG TPA: porin family protein [Rhodocyclaceae bacterium]
MPVLGRYFVAGISRLLRTVASVVLLAGLSTAALAAIDTAILERAETLIQSGKADEAYLLLEPHELGNAGDLVFDYLFATAALESGRPSRATFIYERILAVEPGYVGVRADMGRAYYALGDYARAKIEFETVLAVQNLPPDLRSTVEQYVSQAEARAKSKRTIASVYTELAWGYDTNIAGATGARSIVITGLPPPNILDLNPPDTRTQDHYLAVALGGEITHQLSDVWAGFVGGDIRSRRYRNFDQIDNWSGDGRVGFNYAGGRWLLRGTLSGGQYTQNSDRLRDSIGLGFDWRYAVSNSSQITLNLGQTRYTYVSAANRANDNDTLSGSIGWLQAIGDGSTLLSLSFAGGTETVRTARSDGDRSFGGPRFLVQTSIDESVGAFVTGGATGSSYDTFNDSFLVTREETLYDAAAGVTFALKKGVALRPQLTYVRNKSNIVLFDSTRTDFSLNLRLDW